MTPGPTTGRDTPGPTVPWQRRLFAALAFYPTLLWNCLLGRWLRVRNWWDPIDPLVFVGGYPFAVDAARLHALGVRAVVNTCEEYAGPEAEYAKLGIEQLRIPTTDFTHPQLADVQRAVEFVQDHVRQGEGVYIHCKAGRARSATVALCWLIRYRQMTPAEAQSHLLAARPHVNPHVDRRPVVAEFVRQFASSPTDPMEASR